MKSHLAEPARLTNSELREQLKRLAKVECAATANLIAHLAEFDKRELYYREGCASLFDYCVKVLHLSEDAACQRIQAARAVRKHPMLLVSLTSGELTLSSLRIVTTVLTEGNCTDVVSRVRYKSKREVEEIVANMRPQPDTPTSVKKLRTRTMPIRGEGQSDLEIARHDGEPVIDATGNSAPAAPDVSSFDTAAAADTATAASGSSDFVLRPDPRPVITPLGLERYKVQFTSSAEMHARLRRAQALLLPVIPDGDVAAVLDRALTFYLKHLEKTRRGAADRPRSSKPARPDSRRIPPHLRRLVFERDGERCTELGLDGERCSGIDRLVIDHIVPFAAGGETRLENLRVLCAAHNHHAAKEYFGPEVIEARMAQAKKKRVASGNKGRASPKECHE